MSATAQHPNALLSSFLDRIQQPRTPYISPARFAKAAGLSVQALSAMAGVHRNTLSQHPEIWFGFSNACATWCARSARRLL